MAASNLDIVLSRNEKGPLDRFRNQNLLLKKFGEDGLAVYNLIDSERTAAQLLSESGMKEERFVEILEFMEENSILSFETVEVRKAAKKKEKEPEAPSAKPVEAAKEAQKKKAKPPKKPTEEVGVEAAPEEEKEEKAEEELTIAPEEELMIKPEGLPEEAAEEEMPAAGEEEKPGEAEEKEAPASEEEIAPEEEEKVPEEEAPAEEEEKPEEAEEEPEKLPKKRGIAKPVRKEEADEEAPEEEPEEEKEEAPSEEEKTPEQGLPTWEDVKKPGEEKEEEEEPGIAPEGEVPEEEKEEEAPEEEEEKPAKRAPKPKAKPEEEEEEAPEEEKEEEAPEEEEAPAEEEEAGIAPDEGEEEEKPRPKGAEEESLTPLEKLIHDKYGKIGVKIYNLIDGERTAEEILLETGVSEMKLVEILEFMDSQGIIKLEKPAEATPAEPEKPTPENLAPIAEEKTESGDEGLALDESGELINIIPVDLPIRADLSVFDAIKLSPSLMLKFGNQSKTLFESIDGQKDILDLALSSQLSLPEVDNILAFLGKQNAVLFRTLNRDEIKRKYGSDGFSIYKKYGRDGLLLYQMIGKEPSLREIIIKSKMDPERAIEVFLFIHKVLGLEIPIDKDLLYRQLGIKPKE